MLMEGRGRGLEEASPWRERGSEKEERGGCRNLGFEGERGLLEKGWRRSWSDQAEVRALFPFTNPQNWYETEVVGQHMAGASYSNHRKVI
jgi:hypothetical protein